MPSWFEGGQTPIHIRTPKLHGFKNRFRVEYAGVNLARLAEAAPGTLITPDVLKHDGLLRDRKTKPRPLKILGGGDAPKGVTVHAHAFTRSALAKLADAGSTAQLISWPDGAPISFEPEAPADSGPTGQRARKASAKKASARKAKAEADAEAADESAEQEAPAGEDEPAEQEAPAEEEAEAATADESESES